MPGKEVPLKVLGTGECQAGEQSAERALGHSKNKSWWHVLAAERDSSLPAVWKGAWPPDQQKQLFSASYTALWHLCWRPLNGLDMGQPQQVQKATPVFRGWSTCPVKRG